MTAAARGTERLAGPLPLLGLLADDRTVPLLSTLEAGPISPGEMEQRIGVYPHTTVMDRLATFDDLGVVERTALGGMPNASRVELTAAGLDALRIHEALPLRFARQVRGRATIQS